MDRHQIEAAARAIYDPGDGDDAAYRRRFADAIVWHVPGNNPVSGTYFGAAQYFGAMAERMAPLDEWRFTVEAVEVNLKDRAALVQFAFIGLRRGTRIASTGHHMIRFDSEGRVAEGWGFVRDQDALDAFFSG